MEQFDSISEDVWRLRKDISALGSPSYETIVQRIVSEAVVTDHKRERAKKEKDVFRAIVSIECSAEAITLFHSACSGYRAQYYSSVACGEAANKFALTLLVPQVCRLLVGRGKRTCPLPFIETSLLDPTAKVWIHQGHWLRLAKVTDRGLHVARWVSAQSDTDKKHRKKAIWSMLTPTTESKLELKGGFLSLSGGRRGTLKPNRSMDIHELGFT